MREMHVRMVAMLGGVKVSELEQRLFEVKRLFKEASERAFKASRAYNVLEAKTNELREEWLGLCEVLRDRGAKPYGHLTGLILLKQRVHAEYFRVRLARRSVKARKQELSREADRLWKEYMSLKRCLRAEEEKSCAAQ